MSNERWLGFELPLRPPFAIGGCGLLVSIEVMTPITPGKTSIDVPLPNDRRLLGIRLYQEWMTVIATKGTEPAAYFSNGGIATIGPGS